MQTFGWDTVFAAPLDAVNRTLATSAPLLLSEFDFATSQPSACRTRGRFGAWRIVPGGAGQLLHLELPVLSGSLTTEGPTAACVDLAGVTVKIEISLALLPSAVQETRELRFSFASVGNRPGQTGPGVVTPLDVVDPEARLGFAQAALLPMAIAQCLVENAARVSYVFATVGLVQPDTSGWLAPVASDYCYYETTDGKGAYLAILSATSARDIKGLARQIDPELFAGTGTGFFAVSKELFLRHVVQPALPATYGHGATAKTFTYSKNAIHNTASIACDSARWGPFTYYPKIDSLSVAVQGGSLLTDVTGSCDIGAGASLSFTIRAKNAAAIDKTTLALQFQPDPHPVSTHSTSIPWYLRATLVVSPIIGLIVNIMVPLVANATAASINTRANALAAVKNPAVRWSGTERLTITGARLNDAFMVWGDLS